MDSRFAELFAAASLEFFHGKRPRFFDRCPSHKVFHLAAANDSRPDLLVADRLVDVGIAAEPKLRESLVNADRKIGTEDWAGRYSWRVFIPLSYGDDGQERYSRAVTLKQQCLNMVRALEACLTHGPAQGGACPADQGFLCHLVQEFSPLSPGGFSWAGWLFYAEQASSPARRVDMLPMWSRTAQASQFVRRITSTVNGDDSNPSDIEKKFRSFPDSHLQHQHREVFFVPDLEFLSAARLDVLTHDLVPGNMRRFITGVYVASLSLGGIAHWTRKAGTTWDFRPFPEDFDPQFCCPEG